MPAKGRIELLGHPFDRVSLRQAAEQCLEWCRGPRVPHTVITANASILCMTRRDAQLRDACGRGDLILPDGMSVVWTGRLRGTPFAERVTGIDLMSELLAAGSALRLRAYFLGARREVLERLVRRCALEQPGLVVAGFRDGYFGEREHAAVVGEIREARPHLLFVGMPTPFKETWCERHRGALDVPVIMGVGGAFDVLAGEIRRAPPALQSAGMEWAWRLLMEPRKMWKRYLVTNSEYACLATADILRQRLGLARSAG